MVDIELFKAFLKADDDGYIEPGDHLNAELLALLADPQWKWTKVSALFSHGKWDRENSLFVEGRCEICNKAEYRQCSKTATLAYIRGGGVND